MHDNMIHVLTADRWKRAIEQINGNGIEDDEDESPSRTLPPQNKPTHLYIDFHPYHNAQKNYAESHPLSLQNICIYIKSTDHHYTPLVDVMFAFAIN